MVFFNHATRQMTVKIVYYGPGLCGKTTNLSTLYARTTPKARGEMVSLNTETDRTLFFDLLPMEVGVVGGFKSRLQLYTVPGQVFYNSTRKLVLKGVDGLVFVVDSQTAMLDANRASFLNLQENLRELGLNPEDIPTVFQWNKRDLRSVLSLEELEATFNPRGIPSFQAVASEGQGVFETLRGITRLALSRIKTHLLDEGPAAGAPVAQPLALSDLPLDLELLDLEGASTSGFEDYLLLSEEGLDEDLLIDAPLLPEPPEALSEAPLRLPEPPGAVSEDLAFLLERDLHGSSEPGLETTLPGMSTGTTATLERAMPVRSSAPLPRTAEDTEALYSLLIGLEPVGPAAPSSQLSLVLPDDLGTQDLEIVVQVRQRDRLLLEGQLRRPAPSPGASDPLTIHLQRP
jgi:hypothetical protein